MATLEQKIAAEQKVKELLEHQQVPMPDEIEYGVACIRLFWHAPKVVLVVDIEPDSDAAEAAGAAAATNGELEPRE